VQEGNRLQRQFAKSTYGLDRSPRASRMSIALVLFDMNDVLCRYDRATRIAQLAAITGREPEAIETAIWDSGYEDSADVGAMTADAYLWGFGERIGHPLALGDWVRTLRASMTPLPTALALAQQVGQTVRIAALTNNNFLVAREIAAIFPAIPPIFGSAFSVSAEFGARKPDPEVYRRCIARHGISADATLFVDDSAANVAGAEAAGLMAHRYTTVEALSDLLRQHRLLPSDRP
jgi:FMN phosphatase YigB (HAD superfamily)